MTEVPPSDGMPASPSSGGPAGTASKNRIGWLTVVCLSGMAGGLAWGIRGQYGHETGAMIAGVLVGSTLLMILNVRLGTLTSLRAISALTVGIGLGGSMTYGQTIGWTQDAQFIGNWSAWAWGMTGLSIKGGLWIGLGAVFLGMTLSGARYTWREILCLWLVAIAMFLFGCWMLNSPFNPAARELPAINFSADWNWKSDSPLKPRREVWGGYLMMFLALQLYVCCIKRDLVAVRIGLWGLLGGMLGFPLGQCLQSCNAWSPDLFPTLLSGRFAKLINWWNLMEITFGCVMAAILGLGVWRNRSFIRSPSVGDDQLPTFPFAVDLGFVVIHVSLLLLSEFGDVGWVSAIYGQGIFLAFLPMVGIFGGRLWPCCLPTLVVTLPIAGKTLARIRDGETAESLRVVDHSIVYCVIIVAFAMTVLLFRQVQSRQQSEDQSVDESVTVSGRILLFGVCVFFALNWVVFQHPWPWTDWTVRTPSALLFAIFGSSLIAARAVCAKA